MGITVRSFCDGVIAGLMGIQAIATGSKMAEGEWP